MAVNPAGFSPERGPEAVFVAEAAPPSHQTPVSDEERAEVWSEVYRGHQKALDLYGDKLGRLHARGVNVADLFAEKSRMYQVSDRLRVESHLERAGRELRLARLMRGKGALKADARAVYEAHDRARLALDIINNNPGLYAGRQLDDKLEGINEILSEIPSLPSILAYGAWELAHRVAYFHLI